LRFSYDPYGYVADFLSDYFGITFSTYEEMEEVIQNYFGYDSVEEFLEEYLESIEVPAAPK